jgi:predicted alpha/beta hydrolase family esterase
VSSPFSRPPLVAPERVRIIASAGDAITPIQHAHRLHAHLGGELIEVPGGHLLHLGVRAQYPDLVGWLRDRTAHTSKVWPSAPGVTANGSP